MILLWALCNTNLKFSSKLISYFRVDSQWNNIPFVPTWNTYNPYRFSIFPFVIMKPHYRRFPCEIRHATKQTEFHRRQVFDADKPRKGKFVKQAEFNSLFNAWTQGTIYHTRSRRFWHIPCWSAMPLNHIRGGPLKACFVIYRYDRCWRFPASVSASHREHALYQFPCDLAELISGCTIWF